MRRIVGFCGLVASLVATPAVAHAQARDTVVIVSVSPAGNLRYGTPTEFMIVADVTLASLDTGAVAVGFNVDDPRRYRMFASAAIHSGTQRVTLRATVPPVDWTAQGARFAYVVNIRPLESPSADGRTRGIGTVRGEFGVIRPEYGTVRDAAAQQSTGEQTYFEFQVEKPVRQAPGSAAPRYPPDLKGAGVEGEVLAQFVVDTLGTPVLTTFRVLKSSHGEFTESIKAALPGMKFVPAELRGRKVRQLVQQPFVFAIQKKDSSAAPAGVLRTPQPRPPIPRTTIAPAPPAGTVRGWTLVNRMTIDSGNATPARPFIMRSFGTAGRTRVEIEAPIDSPRGSVVTLTDSATGRRTVILPALMSGTVITATGRPASPFSAKFQPNAKGITDLGAGDTVAGLPTRHYRVEGTTTSRFDLGTQTCDVTQETVTEYWATTDPTFASVQRKFRRLGGEVQLPSPTPQVLMDSNDVSRLGPFLRVVGHNVVPVRTQNGVLTVTMEVLSFSEGTLEASLFEVPEGYQLRDMSSYMPSATGDSLRVAMTKRMFEEWVDTTKVVPGVTTRCTASKAP